MVTVNPNPDTKHNLHTEISSRLLAIVHELSLELQPGRGELRITLDTDLDRELGFDSLSRVELLLRIERRLSVRLPEQIFSTAETPRDLLRAVLSANSAGPEVTVIPNIAPVTMGSKVPVAGALPLQAKTLPEVLDWYARTQPDRPHVQMYSNGAIPPAVITYADLQQGAQRVAAGLIDQGLLPGEPVSLMLPTSRDYLESFFGILLAGGIPVPIYPPLRASQLQDHLQRHAKLLSNAQATILITVKQALTVARLLKSHVPTLKAIVTPEMLSSSTGLFVPVPVQPDDIALLQYTSGSTGQPKGVTLTHAQLLANIRIMGKAIQATPDDVFVSWLPLYHDMGLIGAWLGSLYIGMLAVLMPPTAFLIRPWRWLQTIHNHRGTLSPAPNFAYEMCLAKIPPNEMEGLDLSCWRAALNGAEPISPQTLTRFGQHFAQYGFDTRAIMPVYGLAEAAVGLAFPPLERGALIDRVDREAFEQSGYAKPANPDDPNALQVVACGRPLPDYEIRIVDAAGRELSEREEGRIQFCGPSTTSGYYRNPQATELLFDGDWLNTGDLGYMAGGDVFLTSRVKDVIIRAGRNLYPYELEEAVGNLPEVRKGCVAVFGSTDPDTAMEKLVVVAETRDTDTRVLQDIRQRITALASDLLGAAPNDILLTPPQGVLKTSSGKIRRAACRELYEQNLLGKPARSVSQQMARLWLGALRPQLQRLRRSTRDVAYAGYVHAMFGALFPVAIVCLLLPSLESRWTAVRRCIHLLLRLVRVPLLIEGETNLSETDGYVVISNHASYIDGLMVIAALPSPAAFVAKAELQQNRFAHWFLQRLNASFVERFDAKQGIADAQRVSERAQESIPLMYFPEGTFTRSPGLLAFRMGAFITAAQANLPVIPITLRGTRSILRDDSHFPRRGTVAVIIGQPIKPTGNDWHAALELRNQARHEVLRHLGEPDLMPDSS